MVWYEYEHEYQFKIKIQYSQKEIVKPQHYGPLAVLQKHI